MSRDFQIRRPRRRVVLADDLEPLYRFLEGIQGGTGIRVLKTASGMLITTGNEVAFGAAAGDGGASASAGFPPGFEPLNVLLNINGAAVTKTILVRDPNWVPPS
jgi:hypothetical protein